ncbi:MAG: SPASM domain-containing protein [Deltaproteobacteria bacterium]|nr:SPASM domain-containing protein [Deltaproteobacteria bacterium]
MFERIACALRSPRTHGSLALDQLGYCANILRWYFFRFLRSVVQIRYFQTSMQNTRFCSKPFEHFEVKHDGNVYLCCSGWVPFPVGNLKRDTPEVVWNSRRAKAVRRSILDGSFAFCNRKRCPALKNQALALQFEVEDPWMVDNIRKNRVQLDRGPNLVNAGYDKSCNLKCPSCRTKHVMLRGIHQAPALRIQKKLLDWPKFQTVTTMNITGSGDPFASPIYRSFLQNFTPALFPALRIAIHTNGLLFSRSMWDSMPAIHDRIERFAISIDAATSETYRKLRNGDFDLILERLGFISSLRHSGVIPHLRACFCVQVDNFHEMRDFVRLCKKYRFDEVSFSRLADWGTFSFSEMRARAVHRAGHPLYEEFIQLLQDLIFRDPVVKMGDLAEFIMKQAIRGGREPNRVG